MFAENKAIFVLFVGMLLAFGIGGTGYAAGGASGAVPVKTVVTSDKLLFDYAKSTCVFDRNVIVDDPRVKMKCDKLVIYFTSTNSVKSIVATGSVKVWQDDKVGVCDKAVYTEQSGAVVMTGRAKLQRGKDLVQGREIKIFVNSEQVICTPGKLVIFPNDFKKENRPSIRRR